jgi:hypothetical protein
VGKDGFVRVDRRQRAEEPELAPHIRYTVHAASIASIEIVSATAR